MLRNALICACLLATACSDRAPQSDQSENGNHSAAAAPPVAAGNEASPATPPPLDAPHIPARAVEQRELLGEELALAEWRKAANRESCAPLALASDGGVLARDRRANFSSGWAVAFDSPTVRSVYGFAGTGLLPEDDTTGHADKVAAIRRQWPHGRSPAGLPAGSFAGYGREGARAYSSANRQGRGQHSLAYLRIPGQACLYNVWSRVSRAHLEALLDSLRMVEPR